MNVIGLLISLGVFNNVNLDIDCKKDIFIGGYNTEKHGACLFKSKDRTYFIAPDKLCLKYKDRFNNLYVSFDNKVVTRKALYYATILKKQYCLIDYDAP